MSSVCPTCGNEYKNDNGLATHHTYKHNDEWRDFFEYYINKDTDSGCWEWGGPIAAGGYPQFSRYGETFYGHRLSYRIRYGVIPKPQINHECDNPSCVNPDHLYSGTQSENMKDAFERNDAFREQVLSKGNEHFSSDYSPNPPSGLESNHSKFTADEVREIRRRCENGESQMKIANEYGVSDVTIYRMVNYESYQDVE